MKQMLYIAALLLTVSATGQITYTSTSTTISGATYSNVDNIGQPAINGNGNVTESFIRDIKDDVFYEYQINSANGWGLTGYSSGSNFSWGGDFIPHGHQYRVSEFTFLPLRNIAIQGATVKVWGDIRFSDAYMTQIITSGLDLLTSDSRDYIETIHITQSQRYPFSGLALHDGFVINGEGSINDYLITHEAGHVFEGRDSRIDYDVNDYNGLWNRFHRDHFISDYGASALVEYIAEAFAFYHLNMPNRVPQPVWDELQRIFNKY